MPGSEREVKELKERFLKGKGCPILSKVIVAATVRQIHGTGET